MSCSPTSGRRGDAASRRPGDMDQQSPLVDIRVVLFSRAGDRLHLALTDRDAGQTATGAVGLPRGVPRLGQSLDDTARWIVRESTSLTEQYLEQLYTMSVDQSTRGSWKVIVSYMALLAPGQADALTDGARWVDVHHLPATSSIDRNVIDYALLRLRAKLGYTNIGLYLLPESFTLTELQTVYEIIIGERLDKRNFRRRMVAAGILTQTDGKRRDGSHRPAALYRFRPEEDRASYLTPTTTESRVSPSRAGDNHAG